MSEPAARKRDRSAEVKEAIRSSAAHLFTLKGFDETGIRDIAAGAAVNPALVLRHFGSKEALFVATVNAGGGWAALLEGPVETLGRRVVEGLLWGDARGSIAVFGTVVRASGRDDIRESLHRTVLEHFALPLVERIDRPDAELRGHLFAAQVVGFISALVVYDDDYLRTVDADVLIGRYGDALQATLTGP